MISISSEAHVAIWLQFGCNHFNPLSHPFPHNQLRPCWSNCVLLLKCQLLGIWQHCEQISAIV
jgi:hypothetical protein